MKRPIGEFSAASFLHELYAKENRMNSAYKYLAMADVPKDSLFNQEKVKQAQNIRFKETLRLQKLEQEKKKHSYGMRQC